MTSTIIACLLLSAIPLNVSGNEVNEDFNLDESTNTLTLEQNLFKQSTKDNFDALKPEYEPGEIIVKFRDNLDITFYTSSINAQYLEETIRDYAGETMNTNMEYSVYEQETIEIGESETLQSEEVIMTGFETLDNLNIVYGLTYTEKLIDDDSVPEFSNVYRLCFNKDINVIGAVEDYSNDPNVEFAEPNYIYHFDDIDLSYSYINSKSETGFIPDDPFFDMQWALHNTGQNGGTPDADIDAPEAWDTTMGDDNVVVAVIDSGVDYTNSELGDCTDGIIELDYSLESPHPWNRDGSMLLNFSEIFSQYDFDSISLHFSKIDNYVRVQSHVKILDFFDSKDIIELPYDGKSTTDIWSRYTEMGSKKVCIQSNHDDCWGFAIDKVRLHKWRNVKQSEEYQSKFVDGYDFYCSDPDPMDDNGHGTHCAGIVAAITNNDIGIAGVAGNCKIMPIKLGGMSHMSGFAILRGLIFAANHGADIISMSFGGPENRIMKKVLDYAYNKGCVLVASAGNFNCTAPESTFPGSYDKVIAVGATDRNDSKTVFSSYGSYVDVAAPGQDILSLRAFATDMYFSSGYTPGENFVPQYDNNAILYRASGTSMAGPIVAGVAALILSKNPDLTIPEVRTILRSSTDPVISDKYIGTGRINAFKAVTKAAPVVAEFDGTIHDLVVEGDFDIRGTASSEYFIEYGQGVYPSTWTLIKHSSSPQNGVLYKWDTLEISDGPYILRLRVIYNGFVYEDRAFISIDNIANTYHVDNEANNGDGSAGNPFNKIQYAVDVCCNKDTIFVHSGFYNDSILQETGRSARIIGESKEDTIIQLQEFIQIYYGVLNIEKCTIRDYGILGQPNSDCTFSDNKFINIKKIEFFPSARVNSKINIIKNTFTGEGRVILNSKSNCKISENIFQDYGGITLEYGKRNIISKNIVNYISLAVSNNNDIVDNTIHGGSQILGSSFNNICNNKIISAESGKGTGIFLADGDACINLISKNEIKNYAFGIYISGMTYLNIISENIVSDNSKYGIYFSASYPHIIYLNDIINNGDPYDEKTGNAYERSCKNNIWYCPILRVGNYWSDYTSKYPGADIIHRILRPDIYNIPYDIYGSTNRDMYPLVNQHSSSQSVPQSQPQTQPSTQPSISTTTQTTTSSTTQSGTTTSR